MIEFHFFGMPIKTLGSLGKIRVGRVTGNTHIFFLPYKQVSAFLLCLIWLHVHVRPHTTDTVY